MGGGEGVESVYEEEGFWQMLAGWAVVGTKAGDVWGGYTLRCWCVFGGCECGRGGIVR